MDQYHHSILVYGKKNDIQQTSITQGLDIALRLPCQRFHLLEVPLRNVS